MVERIENQNMFGMKEIRNKAEEKTNINLEASFGLLSIISKVCTIFYACITATNNYEIMLLGNVFKVQNNIYCIIRWYTLCFLMMI